jgi:plastocyanin
VHRALLLVVVSLAALATAAAALPATSTVSQHVSLVVKSDTEHAKKGPDGKWHDAFLPGNFTARAGSPVVVTVRNYDVAPHTIMAAKLGLMVTIRKGSAAHPSTTTFTFTPKTRGTFTWRCMEPCDPWAMTRVGYMTGQITIT